MGPADRRVLARRALQLQQAGIHRLYLFTLTAAEILQVADISRVSRTNAGELIGYQRPKVRQHIHNIVTYLNDEQALFPNAIILALAPTVRFRASRGPNSTDGFAAGGILEIPLPRGGEPRPGWIVDGQQRAIALSQAADQRFPVPITAFVTDAIELQRDQFLRINSARPLPRGLVTELLPQVSTPISSSLAARKLPSALVDALNREPVSPFCGLIRRASTPESARAKAVVTDTSLVRAIQESLNSPSGCLHAYRDLATGATDTEAIWKTLVVYWSAVKAVFPQAWGLPAERSRLMHGVGIRAMGRLMDLVMSPAKPTRPVSPDDVSAELSLIAPHCCWTEGKWEILNGLAWNDLQNVPKHISLLSNALGRVYVQAREEVTAR